MLWQETSHNTVGRNGEQMKMNFLVPVRHNYVYAFVYINVNYSVDGAISPSWAVTISEKEGILAPFHHGPVLLSHLLM